MHYGHANAIRQAKELGDVLVAGIHPTSEIEKHKGLPLMNDEERIEVLKETNGLMRFVDEVGEVFIFIPGKKKGCGGGECWECVGVIESH